MTRPSKSPVDTLFAIICKASLSVEDLGALQNRIEALKEISIEHPVEPLTKPKGKAKGYIEVKTINGKQYRYLRFYVGCKNGRSRYGSQYLGKVQD